MSHTQIPLGKNKRWNQRQYGFSLLEVLIALLVLSIGLLGLAGLQTLGLKFNMQSYQRTQAALLAYDIVDRMRANPVEKNGPRYTESKRPPPRCGQLQRLYQRPV